MHLPLAIPKVRVTQFHWEKDPINPFYLSTFLDLGTNWTEQPDEFAIISGYATTGEQWSAEKNQQADERLFQQLEEKGAGCEGSLAMPRDTGHKRTLLGNSYLV